jgi:hypothetical protein
MFGAFHPSRVNMGGLLWRVTESLCRTRADRNRTRKTPWRLSPTRKRNQRERLKLVDEVIETVRQSGVTCGALVRIESSTLQELGTDLRYIQTNALALPKEHEMPPKDKYTIFNAKSQGYRKGIHKVPKFTRVSRNPRVRQKKKSLTCCASLIS